MALDDLDRATLELESRWYKHAGAKQAAARELGLEATTYWIRLNRLIDDPAAVVEFPTLTARLRRLREERTRQRAPRKAS